jgi:hypothetical protein
MWLVNDLWNKFFLRLGRGNINWKEEYRLAKIEVMICNPTNMLLNDVILSLDLDLKIYTKVG